MKTSWWSGTKSVWVVVEHTDWEFPRDSIVGVFYCQNDAERFAKKDHTVYHFTLEGVYVPNGLRKVVR